MSQPLAIIQDLADVWRDPVDEAETNKWLRLIEKASVMLVGRAPWVTTRLANGTLDPVLVSGVIANAVKRFLQNPSGASSESVGPYSVSFRSGKAHEAGGTLGITDDDIKALRSVTRLAPGSIRTRPGLAPIHIGNAYLEPAELDYADPDGGYPYADTALLTAGVVDGAEVMAYRAGYDHNDNS